MPGDLPSSLFAINQKPDAEKHDIYHTLVPAWVYEQFDIDPETKSTNGRPAVRLRCPAGSRALEISVKRPARDVDPILYLNMADTFNNQLVVLLAVVNDPDSKRYNTDVDQEGNTTFLGTVSRNVPAELAAMQAGLAPGQVRRGLRSFRSLVTGFENFVSRMGHDMYLIEPLAYHNAIIFERYGFNYVRGLKEMRQIDTAFQEGGTYHARLTEDNPFRLPQAHASIRGRAWAIHDGILGHPFTGFQMYKRVGRHAEVSTFPDGQW